MRSEAARRLIAPMREASGPVVVEPELVEFLLGSEDQAVERATRRPDSSLTRNSGSSRAGLVEEAELGTHATGVVRPPYDDSTIAWPDDAQVNEHFALMLACATAPQEFLVDARVFDAPRVLRGHRLAELELGSVAANLMDEESDPTEHSKTRAALLAQRGQAAYLEARRRVVEGGDTA